MNPGALNFDVKISGIEELSRNLQLLPIRVREKMRGALLTTSQRIVKRAKELVAKDTRHLEGGIGSRWSPTNRLTREVFADLGGDPERHIAAPVEFGRKKFNRADAQPFLRPAMEEATGYYFASAVDAVKSAVESITGRGLQFPSLPSLPSSFGLGSIGSLGGGNMGNSGAGMGAFSGGIGSKSGGISGGGGGGSSSVGHDKSIGFAEVKNTGKRIKRHSRRFH